MMNNITFTYNAESALAAGKSGFITESGAYVVTIQEAKYVTSSSGAESIEFSVEADDGKKQTTSTSTVRKRRLAKSIWY